MKKHSIILTICLILSTGCLGVGYILAGYWLILPVLIAFLLVWIFTRNKSVFRSASILFLGYVLLASIGITAGLSSILMIFACATALVSWDLTQFDPRLAKNTFRNLNSSLEKNHLQSLALATFAGLVLAIFSSYQNLQFPFGIIVFLALVAIVCLIYSTQYITKMKH